jgi:hypothetical protein
MTLQAHLSEYEKLKEEQVRRIQFRDNLLYVNLAATGVLASKAIDEPALWLLVPWIGVILGWTYLTNKEQVQRIKRYLGETLSGVVGGRDSETVFGWERIERSRGWVLGQLVIDELTFVVPGLAALAIFVGSDVPSTLDEPWTTRLVSLELAVLGVLCVRILACVLPKKVPVPRRWRALAG